MTIRILGILAAIPTLLFPPVALAADVFPSKPLRITLWRRHRADRTISWREWSAPNCPGAWGSMWSYSTALAEAA